jgi:hypothetical protein
MLLQDAREVAHEPRELGREAADHWPERVPAVPTTPDELEAVVVPPILASSRPADKGPVIVPGVNAHRLMVRHADQNRVARVQDP